MGKSVGTIANPTDAPPHCPPPHDPAADTLPVTKHIRNTDNIDNRNHRLGRPTRRPVRRAARPHGGAMSELDLGREELRELATQVIAAAGDPTEPFGVYLFLPEQPESELPRSVERAVFDEFFGNSAELLDAEYGEYEPSSYFICVLDHRRRLPAGSGRVTCPRPGLQDPGRHRGDLAAADRRGRRAQRGRLGDRRGLGRRDDRRGARVPRQGHRRPHLVVDAAGRHDGHAHVRWTDLGRDPRPGGARAAINVAIHDAWQPFADLAPMRYLDSPLSVPCFVDTTAFEPTLQAADPIMHDIIYRGVGIEAVVRPPVFDPLLQRMAVRPQPPATR